MQGSTGCDSLRKSECFVKYDAGKINPENLLNEVILRQVLKGRGEL